jgi:lipoyl(octanoyl) transferase
MQTDVPPTEHLDGSAEFRLLGQIPLATCLALQRRLVAASRQSHSPRITVLLCEHPQLLTIGRNGSRGHVRLTSEQLAREALEIRWLGRGGGCVLHAPGQLAIYVIAPLDRLGWHPECYARKLQSAILKGLERFRIRGRELPDRMGIWGQSGLLAAMGIALRDGVTLHGAFLNVHPSMRLQHSVDAVRPEGLPPDARATMGCLLAERRTAVRMSAVRSALVESLAESLGTRMYHLLTGHPWLAEMTDESAGTTTRYA